MASYGTMVARPQLANFDEVIADDGVSGVSTRLAERPEGRRLYDKPGSSGEATAQTVYRIKDDPAGSEAALAAQQP